MNIFCLELSIISSQVSFPVAAANPHDAIRPLSIALPPSVSSSGAPPNKWGHGPVSSPSVSYNKHHHKRRKFNTSVTDPTHPTYTKQGQSLLTRRASTK